EVRLGLWINADAACQGVAIEGGASALVAEVAGHGRGQFLDRYRGAPQPKARRDWREVGGDEEVGLQSFDRGRCPSKREHHIGKSIERKAPDYAVGERWEIESDERLRARDWGSPRCLGAAGVAEGAGARQARAQWGGGPGRACGDDTAQ